MFSWKSPLTTSMDYSSPRNASPTKSFSSSHFPFSPPVLSHPFPVSFFFPLFKMLFCQVSCFPVFNWNSSMFQIQSLRSSTFLANHDVFSPRLAFVNYRISRATVICHLSLTAMWITFQCFHFPHFPTLLLCGGT